MAEYIFAFHRLNLKRRFFLHRRELRESPWRLYLVCSPETIMINFQLYHPINTTLVLMIGVLTSYAQMPFRVQQVPWAEYLVNLEKTSFLWLTCWGPAFIGNILLLIQLYDTFYSSSFASLAWSAGAARCFSTKAARSSRSLLPLYSSAWEFRCIWPAHYIYHHFYLFAILVNVESGEAVDTMSTAELPVGIPVGGAVHVPDRHLSIVWEKVWVRTEWHGVMTRYLYPQ